MHFYGFTIVCIRLQMLGDTDIHGAHAKSFLFSVQGARQKLQLLGNRLVLLCEIFPVY